MSLLIAIMYLAAAAFCIVCAIGTAFFDMEWEPEPWLIWIGLSYVFLLCVCDVLDKRSNLLRALGMPDKRSKQERMSAENKAPSANT